MSYRNELIQVAAVAIAAVQVYDTGSTELEDGIDTKLDLLLQEVFVERVAQEKKWGVQRHNQERWLTILHEETGEVARAILEDDM